LPSLGLYGPIEVEYYQLTPVGIQRLTTSGLGGIEDSQKDLLRTLYNLGGTAEFDELKFQGDFRSPIILKMDLAKLIDLGLVTPVQAGAPATVPPQGT
jgi:hypothetical protein